MPFARKNLLAQRGSVPKIEPSGYNRLLPVPDKRCFEITPEKMTLFAYSKVLDQ